MKTTFKAFKASFGKFAMSPKRARQVHEQLEEEKRTHAPAGVHQKDDSKQAEYMKDRPKDTATPNITTATAVGVVDQAGIPKELVHFVKDETSRRETVPAFEDVCRGQETVLQLEPTVLVQEDLGVEVQINDASNPVTIDARDRILVPENAPIPVHPQEDEQQPRNLLPQFNQAFEERFLLNTFDTEAKALKVGATKEDKVVLDDNLLLQKDATTDLLWKPVNPADPGKGDLYVAAGNPQGIIHVNRNLLILEPQSSHHQQHQAPPYGVTTEERVIPVSPSSDSEDTALVSPPHSHRRRRSTRKNFRDADTKWLDDLSLRIDDTPGNNDHHHQPKQRAKAPRQKTTISVVTILFALCIMVMEYLLITRLWINSASPPATPNIVTTQSSPVASNTKVNELSVMAENVSTYPNTTLTLSNSVHVPQPHPKWKQAMVTTLEEILSNALLANQRYANN